MNLKGKTAIITGAGRGIGEAIATKLAREGANIVINYSTSSANAEKIVQEISDNGGKAIACRGDVRNINEVEDIVKVAADTFGSVDILVNNAGITKDTLIMKMS
ncbi:MAG: SDR family NAD(P)-dependent oxidoreductase, partial [Clostridia bacterium]